jgi:hypothetical protein
MVLDVHAAGGACLRKLPKVTEYKMTEHTILVLRIIEWLRLRIVEP